MAQVAPPLPTIPPTLQSAGEIAADGITVNIDPDAWRIIDGKLYLCYNKPTDAEWKDYAAQALPTAEVNWPKLEARLQQGKYY